MFLRRKIGKFPKFEDTRRPLVAVAGKKRSKMNAIVKCNSQCSLAITNLYAAFEKVDEDIQVIASDEVNIILSISTDAISTDEETPS